MLEHHNFYLVGIKGVAMTALAGCLLDLGKTVRGSDVAEDFVTKDNLARLKVVIDQGFAVKLPEETQVVIFSGANGGSQNPQVIAAKKQGLVTLSHARALGEIFNQKKGIAVCGVGGKSTISGMLAFLSEQIKPQSYSVGVGEIIGVPRTGQYRRESEFFIAEADEYVEDPVRGKIMSSSADQQRLETAYPRFHFLKPVVIICSSVRFDHPDVYQNLAQTKQVYLEFFRQLQPNGKLIFNGDEENLRELSEKLKKIRPDVQQVSYGVDRKNDCCLSDFELKVNLPGEFNRLNALAALLAAESMDFRRAEVLAALSQYRSVKRRFEWIGKLEGVECWDDYAHHPSEVKAAITAMQAYNPGKRLVIAFQPHTFSRTKQLLGDFVDALAHNPEVILVDIFPSAREAFDQSICSDDVVRAIQKKYQKVKVQNVRTMEGLREFLHQQMKAGEVFLTLGAGDIYQVYDKK